MYRLMEQFVQRLRSFAKESRYEYDRNLVQLEHSGARRGKALGRQM